MTSNVEIVNWALTMLGARRITSLTQEGKAAETMNALFEPVRDALLEQHPWNFSIRRTSQPALTEVPVGTDFERFIALPADFLRLWALEDQYGIHPETIGVSRSASYVYGPHASAFRLEATSTGALAIATNLDAPLAYEYVARVTDPQRFSSLFRQAFACKLAMEAVTALPNASAPQVQYIARKYDQTIMMAKRTDGIQNPPDYIPETSWSTSRYWGW